MTKFTRCVFSLCLLAVLAAHVAVKATEPSVAPAKLDGKVASSSADQIYGRRRPVTSADREAIQNYRLGHKQPLFSTTFSSAADLQANWTIEEDDKSTLASCRRPGNVAATSDGLRLKTLVSENCHSAHWSTGHISSKAKFGYGFYEATIKVSDISGMNNAFWLTTDDHYEIDIAEEHNLNYIHYALHNWPISKGEKHTAIGWGATFTKPLSNGYHDIGLLWTPSDLVFEIDGEPVAAAATNHLVNGPATIRFSTALADWAGKVPDRPEGHDMLVKSLRVYGLD